MAINQETWNQVSPLLDEALELQPSALESWLANLSVQQPALAAILRDLMSRRAAVETCDFLNSLPALPGLNFLEEPSNAQRDMRSGTHIGPYLLEEEIGRGGMGTVWRATGQVGGLRRTVALKLLHGTGYIGNQRATFVRERDILLALDHPAIARLFDAGISDAGQPYLALEHVSGLTLDRHADEKCLTIESRLKLFRQVAKAVAFAHSRLVIHRDLKPSNVMVGSDGVVRLLDFGVAKLLPATGELGSALTEMSFRVLTPRYAAPEQVCSEPVTTSTDIYALGVMLYELLSGSSPYRPVRDSRGALEDAIVVSDPIPPSQTVSAASAGSRSTSAARLRQLLRGDLDIITLKALKKKPADRFATADALVQDIDNYLAGAPVLAVGDSVWYRTRKFITRYRLPAALAAALVLATTVGLSVSLWQLHSAREQAARAEATKGFLLKVFSSGNPSNTGGKNISASDILERGATQLDTELGKQPSLLGELHVEIADIYSSLGANEDMLRHATRAAQLFESIGVHGGDAYFNALYRIADARMEEGHWPEVRAAYERLRVAARKEQGPRNPWEARALEDLIVVESSTGHLPVAQALSRQALAMTAELFGERSRQYLRVLGTSEQLYLDAGQPEEALKFIRRVIELSAVVPDYALADRLMDRYMLGSTLYRLQRYGDSAAVLRQLVPEMESNMGLGNDRTSKARNTLALDLMLLGDLQEALAIQRRNIALLIRLQPGEEELLIGQQGTLSRILVRLDRFEEAIKIQRNVVTYYDQHYRTPTLLRERFRSALGEILVRAGRAAEGVVTLERATSNMNQLQDYRADSLYAQALELSADGYRNLGRDELARTTFDRACGLYESLVGKESVSALRCRTLQVLAQSEQDVSARRQVPLRATLRSLANRLIAQLPPRHPLRAELLLAEAEIARRAGAAVEATALEERGSRTYRDLIGVAPALPLRAMH